mmetsp:Transcript_35609/g.107590  ORF Transcript_35609/g.107590 Transcript_35609/m.107590 type:complete len:249 (-) Transcript_35609:836-1582(-)
MNMFELRPGTTNPCTKAPLLGKAFVYTKASMLCFQRLRQRCGRGANLKLGYFALAYPPLYQGRCQCKRDARAARAKAPSAAEKPAVVRCWDSHSQIISATCWKASSRFAKAPLASMKTLLSVASQRARRFGFTDSWSWMPITMRSGLPGASRIAACADSIEWALLCWSSPSVSATIHCWFPEGETAKFPTQLTSASQKAVPPLAYRVASSVFLRKSDRLSAATSCKSKQTSTQCENLTRLMWSSSSMC